MFMSKEGNQRQGVFDSVLSKGTQAEGTIHSKGSIRIDGEVKGRIEAVGDVMIGETASVDSDIEGNNVIIAGTVVGNVRASGKLDLLSTGNLKGEVYSCGLVVSEGAKFTGSFHMVDNGKQAKLPQGPKQ